MQGRERVVRDLGTGLGHGPQQCGLAGVRQAQQPHVRQQRQIQVKTAGFAARARRVLARRPVDAGLEAGVAPPSAPAAGHQQFGLAGVQFAQHFLRVGFGHPGTGRHRDSQFGAGRAASVTARARPAVAGPKHLARAEIGQRVDVRRKHQCHVAAVAAVAAVGAAARNVLLAAEAHAAVPAVAGANADPGFVGEFHGEWWWLASREATTVSSVFGYGRLEGRRLAFPPAGTPRGQCPRSLGQEVITETKRRFAGPLRSYLTTPSLVANRV